MRRLAPVAGFLLAASLALAAPAMAGEQRAGDFVVRYNALASANLPAASLKRYGISREPGQGLLIVAVAKAADDSDVPATVEGRAMTLLGAPVAVTFRRVDDAGTVSYLGTYRVPSAGTLQFTLSVTPQGGATQTVGFTQDFAGD